MHFGHANALRQAKNMGDYLVVGVHSDEVVLVNKGPTVMKEDERYKAVLACKWVDEVVKDTPYSTELAFMDRYKCQFCVHGDDVTTMADGSDCYSFAKEAGRYKEFSRTNGVSTTEMVGRMLLLSKEHHVKSENYAGAGVRATPDELLTHLRNFTNNQNSPVTHILPDQTSLLFAGQKVPPVGACIVYVAGAFDLFHVGHVEFLKRAKERGDFLIVGIHDDATVNSYMGSNYPIMNLHERLLSLLACRYVDEVIISAPFVITKALLEHPYKINIVYDEEPIVTSKESLEDSYDVSKLLGIFQKATRPPGMLTTEIIIERIIENRRVYEERNKRKMEKAALEFEMKTRN